MGPGILLCLPPRMVPGASQRTVMMEQVAGMMLDPLTKSVVQEVGIHLLLTGINHL
jgi:hypothetical protein